MHAEDADTVGIHVHPPTQLTEAANDAFPKCMANAKRAFGSKFSSETHGGRGAAGFAASMHVVVTPLLT